MAVGRTPVLANESTRALCGGYFFRTHNGVTALEAMIFPAVSRCYTHSVSCAESVVGKGRWWPSVESRIEDTMNFLFNGYSHDWILDVCYCRLHSICRPLLHLVGFSLRDGEDLCDAMQSAGVGGTLCYAIRK